jgi:hypothetical protein
VGQDRQDWPGHSSDQRASVREAAELLGTTVAAIRKRVQRGTIPYEKASDGRVWIVLDAVQDSTGHRQDTEQPQSDSSALISAKDETIAALRDQLEAERQAHAEAPTTSSAASVCFSAIAWSTSARSSRRATSLIPVSFLDGRNAARDGVATR